MFQQEGSREDKRGSTAREDQGLIPSGGVPLGWDQPEADRLAQRAVAAFNALRWPQEPARAAQIGKLADSIDREFLARDLARLRLAVGCFITAAQVVGQECQRALAEDYCPGQASPPASILRSFERERAQARQTTPARSANGKIAPTTAQEPAESFSTASLFST